MLHYTRLMKHGDVMAHIPPRHRKRCTVEGCGKPVASYGLCDKHYWRQRNIGEIGGTEDRRKRSGADNPLWQGNNIGYAAAHNRVARERGPAANHPCADCGKPANHWSYDKTDPDELYGHTGQATGVPYSADPSRYHPRCRSCHFRLDMNVGEKHHRAKLTAAQVEEIHILRAQGFTGTSIAARLGVSHTHVYNVLNGRSRVSG